MAVIAMNQEMGSLGKDVAQALAEDLGLAQVTHEVMDHVAHKLQTRKSLIRRVIEGKAGMLERMRTDARSVSTYVAEEVYELAARDDIVIRGWGATYLLRAIPHIPCVRVCASMDSRMRWLMRRLDTDDEELVRQELQRSDAAHTHNMRQRFGASWGDPLLYDMVLNTDRISVDGCVEQIKILLRQPEFQPTDASRAILADARLEAHIRAALRASHASEHASLTIGVVGGRVSLQGVVADEATRTSIEATVRGVEGVIEIHNGLDVATLRR